MYTRELDICMQVWASGAGQVTGAASARLLRLFVDCCFRHHEPGALLLKVMERGEVSLHTAGCDTRAAAATGGGRSSPAPSLS